MPVVLASFLLSITSSIVARVFTSIGLGVISYAALSTLLGTITAAIISNYNGMPAAALAIVNLSGFGTAVGILISAMVVRVSLVSIKHIGLK